MTSDGGIGGQRSKDLPGDLLGVIYCRCTSPHDRARFAAVCTSWRTAASCQPKLQAVPLLYPSTGNGFLDQKARRYCPEDGSVLRAGLPWFPNGARIVGSHEGGWVALLTGCHQIEIINLFNSAWVPQKGRIELPWQGHVLCQCPAFRESTHKISIEKVVFSENPTSKDCILAAMTTCCMIALCRLVCPGGEWTAQGCGMGLIDLAFCNGELYGLSCSHLLYRLVLGLNRDGAVLLISLEQISIFGAELYGPRYIFELHGKLATAVKVEMVRGSETQAYSVFELTSIDTTTQSCKYMWAEETSLGDHALFLGPGCCKAVDVSAASMHGKVLRNCVYYSKQQHFSLHDDPECLATLDLGSCAVYCYERQGVNHSHGIMSRGYHYPARGDYSRNSCTWILPPYF